MSARLDLIGRRFGKGVVLELVERKKCGTSSPNIKPTAISIWKLQCDCGNIYNANIKNLCSGGTKSCGCAIRKDRSGMRCGMLTVLKFSHITSKVAKNGRIIYNSYWLCKCDCGTEKTISANWLDIKKIGSCGCRSRSPQSPNKFSLEVPYYKYIKHLYRQIKRRKNVSLTNDITVEFLEELYKKQDGKCAMCGFAIDLTNYSLDRIDSQKGYSRDNVQLVWKTINFMKGVLDSETFIQFCNGVAKTHPRETGPEFKYVSLE